MVKQVKAANVNPAFTLKFIHVQKLFKLHSLFVPLHNVNVYKNLYCKILTELLKVRQTFDFPFKTTL